MLNIDNILEKYLQDIVYVYNIELVIYTLRYSPPINSGPSDREILFVMNYS
jgi:hypothetical protein